MTVEDLIEKHLKEMWSFPNKLKKRYDMDVREAYVGCQITFQFSGLELANIGKIEDLEQRKKAISDLVFRRISDGLNNARRDWLEKIYCDSKLFSAEVVAR